MPGAPEPTTFPAYQGVLTKEYRDKFGPTGNPSGVTNPFPGSDKYFPEVPAGANPPSDPEGQLEPPKRIYISKPDDDPAGYAAGGHIRGPGSSTSDSIPAMLSDGEYVVKADAVKRMGVDKLDAINSGAAHFADGGAVATAANDESGNFISSDGRYYHFRNKAEKDAINGAINKANADAQRQEAEQRKHTKKSEFVGSYDPTDTANRQYRKEDDTSYFADGELVGDSSPAVSSFRSRLTAMALLTAESSTFHSSQCRRCRACFQRRLRIA